VQILPWEANVPRSDNKLNVFSVDQKSFLCLQGPRCLRFCIRFRIMLLSCGKQPLAPIQLPNCSTDPRYSPAPRVTKYVHSHSRYIPYLSAAFSVYILTARMPRRQNTHLTCNIMNGSQQCGHLMCICCPYFCGAVYLLYCVLCICCNVCCVFVVLWVLMFFL
jgi:hypothetical protein